MGSCEDTARRMSAHAEDDLRGFRRWRMFRHLAACERCRAIFRSLVATIEGLRALGGIEPEARPATADLVVERIRGLPRNERAR